jgi:large subunit ribosomal protein L13
MAGHSHSANIAARKGAVDKKRAKNFSKLSRAIMSAVRQAVKRMLPKANLGRDMLRRLKIYAGTDHPHMAQQPVKVETIRS